MFSLGNKKFFFSLITLIFFLGFYFRIKYYDDGLWSDEWISFYISSLDLSILDKYSYHLEHEGSSPINLFFNSFLLNIFGISYQSLEKFYILSGILLLIFSFELNEKKDTKIFYLLLLSLNPFLIYYSGELRFYTLSVLFSMLSFIFFIKLDKKKSTKRIILFAVTTLLSLLFNVFTIGLIISYFIFNYFKNNNKKIYFLLLLITIIFLTLNIQHFLSITTYYHLQFEEVGGNINLKFFVGYFFNIFFGDKLFGAISLILFLYSIFYLRKKILVSDQLFLSYLIIFITYLMLISYALIISDILFPRYFIFIVPFIIYSIVFFIFNIKNFYLKYFLILIFIIMSLYVNFKTKKPYILDKPNPNYVNNKIFNSDTKYIYIPVVKKMYSLENDNCCNYYELLFVYSETFQNSAFTILLNDQYKDHEKFWSICIVNPSFRTQSKASEVKNCYGKLDFLENNYEIKKKFSSNSFDAYLYKKINLDDK